MITIPTIGSCLTLTQDWVFDLWAEDRNQKFWISIFGDPKDDPELAFEYQLNANQSDPNTWMTLYRFWKDAKAKKEAVLPAGTVLKVSRIYIRQGLDGFDSITFTLVSDKFSKFKGRFWAKLEDVNRIEADWDEKTIARKR